MTDKLDLVLEIVNNLDKKVNELKKDNSSSHAILFSKLDETRKDINGLKEFRTKVLTIASLIAIIISAVMSVVLKKIV